MIHDPPVGPGAVLVEEGERCVPVEELQSLALCAGEKDGVRLTVTAGVMPLACISEITSS